jgi:flotillin
LSTMTLVVKSPTVITSQGVPISVTGVAQVKINGSNEDMLKVAAEQFGNKSEEQIASVAHETLEGHQREIISTMTVEEIFRDRHTFSAKVFEVSSTDLINMGIMVISYTIHDIKDDVGYLKSLGQARTAEVQRDARIGEATAQMQATMTKAEAEMTRMESKLANETEIARAKRDFDLKKASYDVEVDTARAEAELAYSLQAAVMQQLIKEEEMQVMVVERMQAIEIEQQEIQRRHHELEAQIKKPAEAEKFKLEKIAEAERLKTILEAEAEAEAIALMGDAEAFALEAKAKAESEQMGEKANAWDDYGKAAMVAMMLKLLPKLAAEVAAPISKVNKIKMVSDGQNEIGASKLTGEILDIMARIPEAVGDMTGFDIKKQMVQKF